MTRSFKTTSALLVSTIFSLVGCSADATSPSPAQSPVTSSPATDPAPAPAASSTSQTDSTTAPADTTPAPAADPNAPKSYEFSAASLRDQLPSSCEASSTIYNHCDGSPVAFSWDDTGKSAPKSVMVDFGSSLFCADPMIDSSVPQVQTVTLNGATLGSYAGDAAACTCGALTVKHSFTLDVAGLAGYVAGGKNEIKIAGPNRCFGLGPVTDSGAVARVSVAYEGQ
jgi:hypothetical protein